MGDDVSANVQTCKRAKVMGRDVTPWRPLDEKKIQCKSGGNIVTYCEASHFLRDGISSLVLSKCAIN